MTKEQLLKPQKRKTKSIEHDGQAYTVRKLTAGEVATLNRDYRGDAKAMEGMRYVFACAVVESDESTVNLFDVTSAEKAKTALQEVQALDYDIVEAVALQAMEFSGLKVKAVSQDDAKNA